VDGIEIVPDPSDIKFEDTNENMLLLADEKSGNVAICSHEVYKSDSESSGDSAGNKFLIRYQPKVLLIPSISEKVSGPLLSHCLVRCPAPGILNGSPLWLCTLHTDNVIRLWNIDDGRCIMNSSQDLLVTKGLYLKNIKGFPGHVLLIGDQGDVYIINVYTM
jgi:hypothetical protein